jgi:nitroreductase
MDYEDFLDLVKKRRSIRSFRTDPVPDEYVNKIIEAARYAPSGANSQPWEFIVVKDQEIKDRIAGIVSGQSEYSRKVELTREKDLRFSTLTGPVREPAYKNAPVYVILCSPRLHVVTRISHPALRARFFTWPSRLRRWDWAHSG